MEIRNILARIVPDTVYIQLVYHKHFGRFADLKHPRTFNEKIQWLKLHDRNPQHTIMVDKYLAKDYVAGSIGREYIIPTLGVWERPEDIEFDKLPEQFVLKWNHDSGSIVICKDRNTFDKQAALRKLSGREKYNGYNYGREWPYKNVKPVIIAEAYMEDDPVKGELSDYKIHCFNGEPKVVQVIADRFSKDGMVNDHYTLEWEKLDLVRGHYSTGTKSVPRPAELDEMLRLAKMLSKGTTYLRTDFYIVNHHIYFGELTFFPASGFNPFTPEKWDSIFGEWIRLPINKG